ncbi:unnamed protein product [Pleuronectes platessa]|uniref:Uncharacterized protein n=1 Tax=Pleuronectes platessa TaxID=8262 RepID=A0A9N7TPN9_PLEPL|nr:unnamed protein product [Pleuronectes platessa]
MQQTQYNVNPNQDTVQQQLDDGQPPPYDGQPPQDTVQPPPDTVQPPPDTVQPPPDTVQPPPDTVQPPPDTVQQPPDTVQQPPETVQQPPETVQLPPDTVQPPPDTVQPPPYDGQPPPETVQPPPDTVQQNPYDIDFIEETELAQNGVPSLQWSDSVDSEETTRRKFVTELVMHVIKKSQMKDAGDPLMVSYTKRLVQEILKGLEEVSLEDLCSKSVAKAVYSKLHSKLGKNLRYLLLLPDPGVIKAMAKCFQLQILKRIAKPCLWKCSRECVLKVLSGVMGQALDRGAIMLKVDKICTGHNADDVAEMFFYAAAPPSPLSARVMGSSRAASPSNTPMRRRLIFLKPTTCLYPEQAAPPDGDEAAEEEFGKHLANDLPPSCSARRHKPENNNWRSSEVSPSFSSRNDTRLRREVDFHLQGRSCVSLICSSQLHF